MKPKDTCLGGKSLPVRKAEQNSWQSSKMGPYQDQWLLEKQSHCDWAEVKQGTSRERGGSSKNLGLKGEAVVLATKMAVGISNSICSFT